MAAQGQGFLDDDRPDLAGAVLRQALALWSGPPLANVSAGPILTGYITALEEERTRALNTRIEADLRVGRFRELIPELHRLIVEYPYDEWYYELLIFTLARVGRRHDALHTYLRARRLLADDLGLTPSRQLARMQEAILGNGELSPPTSQLHRQALDARTAS
jgi:DNA-binding SARP family transcriptional activator